VPDPLVRPVESLMRGTGQRKKLRKIAKFYAKDVALLQQNIAECLGDSCNRGSPQMVTLQIFLFILA